MGGIHLDLGWTVAGHVSCNAQIAAAIILPCDPLNKSLPAQSRTICSTRRSILHPRCGSQGHSVPCSRNSGGVGTRRLHRILHAVQMFAPSLRPPCRAIACSVRRHTPCPGDTILSKCSNSKAALTLQAEAALLQHIAQHVAPRAVPASILFRDLSTRVAIFATGIPPCAACFYWNLWGAAHACCASDPEHRDRSLVWARFGFLQPDAAGQRARRLAGASPRPEPATLNRTRATLGYTRVPCLDLS